MSLLKWKKLAKQKTELGNKINFVHDTILKNQLGEKTSQESFQKVFKPITTKLDDVAFRNLNLPRLTKKRGKKQGVPDYGIALEDEDIPDYDLENLFDEGFVPENEKQIVPKPPTYEEALKDILEGNPQHFSEEDEEDGGIDYALDEKDSVNYILDDIGITNYDNIEKQLNQPEMTPRRIKRYLNMQLELAITKRYQLNGLKSQVSQAFNKGKIGEAKKAMDYNRIDNARDVLNKYIEHYQNKVEMVEMKKGSGIKKRGGNIVFFNDVKQLLKKLELIVGEILAGNTSIEMRNTGVAILDMLLKTSKINKAQHEKLYKTYFKV